jgi:hypothetical protein
MTIRGGSGRDPFEAIGNPVEDELVGERRVVMMALRGRRFRAFENLQ